MRSVLLLSVLACACGTPDFETDLLPEGPPEVTLVNVASESDDEAATFCGAPKRNLFYCPETGDVEAPVSDAPPLGLFVRIAFDELLDPSIETIETVDDVSTGSIAGANPVNLLCAGAAVSYDGFYQPGGSHLTDPPGPALVIEADGVVPAGSTCTVEILDSVEDKSGNQVPAAARGPYEFQLAPFSITGTNPQDMTMGLDADIVAAVAFNNLVDEASLVGNITVNDGAADVTVDLSVDPMAPNSVLIAPSAGTFALDTTFTVTVNAGILDLGGASFDPPDGPFTFTFSTGS